LLGPALALLGCALPAQAASVLSHWQIQPVYRTDYKVSESEKDWKQSLTFGRASERLAFDLRMTSGRRENERRNNFRRNDDKMILGLSRPIPLGTVSLESSFLRLADITDRSKKASTDETVDLVSSLALLTREDASLNLKMNAGYLREVNTQIRYGSRASVDSTIAPGWTGGSSLNSKWNPGDTFAFTGRFFYDTTVQESETFRTETSSTDTLHTEQKNTDRSFSMNGDFTVEWDRYELLSVSYRGGFKDSESQYYHAAEEAQESKRIVERRSVMQLYGERKDSFGYVLEYSLRENETDFVLLNTDRSNTSDDVSIGGYYNLGGIPLLGSIPGVRGTEFSVELNSSDGQSVTQGTASYNTRRQELNSEVRRRFATILELVGKYRESLTQDMYGDGALDKDRLRTELNGTIKYTPSPGFRANLTYTAKSEESIKIPAATAAQTQQKDDHNVNGSYTWTLPFGPIIKQTIQLGATYTYYVFDEDKNDLTRNNRVVSELDLPLFPGTMLGIKHTYRRNDSGAHQYAEDRRFRTYAPSRKSLSQNLRVNLRYEFPGGFHIAAQQVMDLNHNTTVSTGSVRSTEKYEFTGKAGLKRTFSSGLNLTAQIQRVNSNVKDDFWRVNAVLEKTFK